MMYSRTLQMEIIHGDIHTYIVATIAPRGGSRLQKKSISEYPSIPIQVIQPYHHSFSKKNDEAIEGVRPRPGMNEPQLHLSQGQANVETDVIGNTKKGPNPWKVAIILEELGVPYHQEFLDFGVLKQEPFISANPNGRLPALEDPNTSITLFEVSHVRKESGTSLVFLLAFLAKRKEIKFSNHIYSCL